MELVKLGSTTRPVSEPQQRILLVAPVAKQARSTIQVLRCLVAHVETCESIEQAPPGPFDLIIADFGALAEQRIAEAMARLGEERGQQRLLICSEARSRAQLQTFFEGRPLTNLVARNDDLDLTDFIVTVQKILRRDLFGIEKYFSWGVSALRLSASRSDQKAEVVAEAERFASAIGLNPRIVTLFSTVADEFFTNAIYNAPTDAEGRSRYASRSRTELVALEPGEEVEIKLCSDGRRLGISVSDGFGSLTPDLVHKYLNKCFRGGPDQVDQKPGGAGLGLFYVFELLSHFVINISPGRRTEMIGLLDVRGTYRDLAGRAKSFNIFVGEH